VAISGLRSGAAGGGAGRSGRTRQGVPAAAGFGEEAEAGPLGELGEQVCLAWPCSRHSLVMLGAGEPGGRTWLAIISRTIAAMRT